MQTPYLVLIGSEQNADSTTPVRRRQRTTCKQEGDRQLWQNARWEIKANTNTLLLPRICESSRRMPEDEDGVEDEDVSPKERLCTAATAARADVPNQD